MEQAAEKDDFDRKVSCRDTIHGRSCSERVVFVIMKRYLVSFCFAKFSS